LSKKEAYVIKPVGRCLWNIANLKILKSYHFVNLNFNEQYSYLHMLMARKNLDQALNEPKNRLIKFNEQIASKYRAGLSLKYLDSYLENDIVHNTIKEFIQENQYFGTNSRQFETVLLKNSPKDINWFFRTIIETKDLIDYKFGINVMRNSLMMRTYSRLVAERYGEDKVKEYLGYGESIGSTPDGLN
jgi:hypothetical protein